MDEYHYYVCHEYSTQVHRHQLLMEVNSLKNPSYGLGIDHLFTENFSDASAFQLFLALPKQPILKEVISYCYFDSDMTGREISSTLYGMFMD